MNKYTLSLVVLCAAPFGLQAEKRQQFTYEYGLADAIADSWVRSFPVDRELTKEEREARKSKKLWRAEMPTLSKRQRVSTTLAKIYAPTDALKDLEAHYTTLNAYSWDDLKLLYGTRTAPDYHLVSRLNDTCTTFGEAALAALLVTPVNDIEELRQRQEFIKELIGMPARMIRMREALKKFAPCEEGMISFWTDGDPLFDGPYEEFVNQLFYFKALAPFNSSATSLETSKRLFNDCLMLGMNGMMAGGMLGMAAVGKGIYGQDLPVEVRGTLAVSGGIYGYLAYMVYDQMSSPIYYLAQRLRDVKYFVEAAKEINRQVRRNVQLESLYGHKLERLRKVLDADRGSEMGQFIANLDALNLDAWSYFFRHTGRLLRSYKLLLAVRDQLNEAIFEVGQLDAYLSIAHTVAESEGNRNSYTFAKFLTRAEQPTPYVSLVNMWNPFLDADKAVPTSFEMDSAGGVRNAVITGPNAGGKSTFITGLATSLLLAQTFGIVAAERAEITPFNKISTYINLTDDIAEGNSLFMAEVKRAQDHLDTLAGLAQDEFSFSIMDELFSGTNPVEGEAAAYSIAHHMGTYKNGLNVLATHFPRLTLLEERAGQDGFKNYKVIVHQDKETGVLSYPFTIFPGKSNQAIAIDILEQEGYDSSLLEEARDIINNPEKYPASFH